MQAHTACEAVLWVTIVRAQPFCKPICNRRPLVTFPSRSSAEKTGVVVNILNCRRGQRFEINVAELAALVAGICARFALATARRSFTDAASGYVVRQVSPRSPGSWDPLSGVKHKSSVDKYKGYTVPAVWD